MIIPPNDSLNNKFSDIYKFEVNLYVFLVDNHIYEIRILNNSNSYYLRIIVENYIFNNINEITLVCLKCYLFNNIIFTINNISCFL